MLFDCLRFENSITVNSHTDWVILRGSSQDGAGAAKGAERMVVVTTSVVECCSGDIQCW